MSKRLTLELGCGKINKFKSNRNLAPQAFENNISVFEILLAQPELFYFIPLRT